MRQHRVWTISIALLLAAGCGGHQEDLAAPAALEHLHGSSAAVSLQSSAGSAQILVSRVEETGTFLRLHMAPGQQLVSETWQNDGGTLHIVAPVDGGLDIGIVGLKGYSGEPVSLSLELATGGGKVTSRPPTGAKNVIPDLAVSDAGAGLVSLAWTQRNVGDYDFNGEVNIADLTPLGQHFGETVNRGAAGADQVTEFWVDGDENGEVNLADLTVIGQNYTAFVAGYNIRHNGTVVLNGQGQSPTLSSSDAMKHPGLPPTYQATLTGAATDSWTVTSVDAAGAEGADSSGGVGPVDLYVNFNISGLDLLNLVGSGSGPFGSGKFGSRVIDPINIVDNIGLGTTTLAGTSAQTRGLPRGKTLLARAQFAPVVNLATGAPKGGASIKGSSSVTDAESEFISVPFKLPLGTDPVSMSMDISMDPNPGGGYFVTLTATLDVYGDDLATPAIETKYVKTYTNRLEYATGKVSRDTDADDIFDGEEAEYEDSNHDCISEMEVENEEDWDGHEEDERGEIEAVAVLDSIDFDAGTVTFNSVVVESPPGATLGSPLTVRLAEETEYELRIKIDGGDDVESELDPKQLAPGNEVEFDIYELKDPGTGNVYGYWCEKIRKVVHQT